MVCISAYYCVMFNQIINNMNTIELNLPALESIKQQMEVISTKLEEIQNSNPLSKEWLTNSEASEFLSVTSRTMQNYRDNGVISFSQVGSKIYYKASDLEKHLESHYVKSFMDSNKGRA